MFLAPRISPQNLRPCVKLETQMFSLIWSFIQTSFRQPKPVQLGFDISEVDQQNLQDLAVAAETGMVSTRSQEPGLVVDFEQKPPKGTPGLTNTKRKSSSESHSDTLGSRPHKRHKEATQDGKASFASGNTKPLIPIVSPTRDSNIPNDGIEVRIANGHERDNPEGRPSSLENNTPPESPSQQDDVHITRETSGNSAKRHAGVGRSLVTHSSEPIQTNGKPRHKRFGSQDPPERPLPASQNNSGPAISSELPINVQMDEEPEDEVPEIISASTGLDQARLAANEAAKVAEACVVLNSQLSVTISDAQ